MFFISPPKDPGCLTYIFFITGEFPTLVPMDSPTLPIYRIFVFWFDQYILNSSISLEVGVDSIPLAYILMLSPSPCVYGITICSLLYFSLVESPPSGLLLGLSVSPLLCSPWLLCTLLSSWLLLVNLLSILSKAHLGYLHLARAFLRCCIS